MEKRIGRPKTGITPNTTVRVDPDILHQARVAAVIQKKTMGRWLGEAILEKIERDEKLNKALGPSQRAVATPTPRQPR